MTITVLHVPTADLARNTVADVTIEAEYGSFVWEGTSFTAAHHQKEGPYAGNHVVEGGQPSPCNNEGIIVLRKENSVIGVSHFDLDTLGGVLRAMGLSGFFGDRLASFWALAEFVDVNGPHKLGESGASWSDLDYLHAFWAWGQSNRPRWSRDEVTDITGFIGEAEKALRLILSDDEAMLQAGRDFKAAGDKLNADTFVEYRDGVVIRVAPAFVNHLYDTPEGQVGRAVVSYSTTFGSITVSFSDGWPVGAREIVQSLWGPEAGGHAGIAGSPRGQRMTLRDLEAAVEAVLEREIRSS